MKDFRQFFKGNGVALDSKAQRSSEQTKTLSFCPRSCCVACASLVSAGDAGGAGGAEKLDGVGPVDNRPSTD